MAEGGIANLVELSGQFHIKGIVDVPDKLHKKLFGYKIIATDDDLPQLVKKMKESYDKEVDALYIELSTQKPDGVIEIEEGINIDVSSDGSIVGIEFIDAAKKMPLDSFLKYEIDGESIGLMAMMQRNKNNSPLNLEP